VKCCCIMCRRFSIFRWEVFAKSSVVALQRELKNKCTLSRTHLWQVASRLCVFLCGRQAPSAEEVDGGFMFLLFRVGALPARRAAAHWVRPRKTPLRVASPHPSHVLWQWAAGWQKRGISSFPYLRVKLLLSLPPSYTQCERENKAKTIIADYRL
jgi:hypothetical protein